MFNLLSERPGISRAFSECCAEDLFGRRFKIEFAEAFAVGIHVKFHPKRIFSGYAAVDVDIEAHFSCFPRGCYGYRDGFLSKCEYRIGISFHK